MVQKPIPIELAIKIDTWSSEFGGRLFLTPATEDARSWVEKEAPQFGQLFAPLGKDAMYQLFVNQTYKASEVAKYLREGYKNN